MPLELQVIRAGEFVCLDADEHLNLEASRQALESLALACRKRGLDRALLGLRGLPVLPRPHFSPTELAALVGTFRDTGFSKRHRLAILYRHDDHGGIRSFAFIGRMRGLQVRAFNDFEAAMNWLGMEPRSRGWSLEEGAVIPISGTRRAPRRLSVGDAIKGGGSGRARTAARAIGARRRSPRRSS